MFSEAKPEHRRAGLGGRLGNVSFGWKRFELNFLKVVRTGGPLVPGLWVQEAGGWGPGLRLA